MNRKVGFNFDDLRAFEAVARLQSFSRAAETLGMAQSSVSQRIGRLETDLRCSLVERTTRHVAVTEQGRILLIYAGAMLGMAAQTRLHFDQPPLEGVLRLGIVEDFVLGDLHRILSLFHKQHPRFALTLRSGLSVDLFRALDDDTLDVVIAKRKPGRATGAKLWSEELVWVGDAAIVPTKDQPVPLAMYPEPSVTRQLTVEALRRAGLVWSVIAESKSINALTAAAASGFGLSVFSRRFVPDSLAIIEPPTILPPIGEVHYVIDHKADPVDAGTHAFVEILTAAARALVADHRGQAGQGRD